MSPHPDSTLSGPALPRPPAAAPEHVEYVVRPCNDNADSETWLIEHAGESYGPYKNCREATFFAIDAARKLGAQGKSTRVKAIDHAGHLLTMWKPSQTSS
jgi:hypothetical protein